MDNIFEIFTEKLKAYFENDAYLIRLVKGYAKARNNADVLSNCESAEFAVNCILSDFSDYVEHMSKVRDYARSLTKD